MKYLRLAIEGGLAEQTHSICLLTRACVWSRGAIILSQLNGREMGYRNDGVNGAELVSIFPKDDVVDIQKA